MPKVWDCVVNLLASAVEHNRGDFAIGDVYRELAGGITDLWVASTGSLIIGAAVTRIDQHPRKRVVSIDLAAADNLPRSEWGRFLAMVDEYARRRGCRSVRLVGRRGWKEVLAQFGWKEVSIVMEKEVR